MFVLRHTLELAFELAWTDFKVRYVMSRMGLAWVVIKPLLTFGVLYGVFSHITPQGGSHYALILLLGIILWNFFAEATSSSIQYVVGKRSLIQRVRFPLAALPLSACLQSLVVLMINLVAYTAVSLYLGVIYTGQDIVAIVVGGSLFLFTLGMAYGLALLNVYVRDVDHIWEVALRLGFFVTPIVYPLYLLPQYAQQWLLLNPLTQYIEATRGLLVLDQTPPAVGLMVIFSLVVGLVGWWLFEIKSDVIRDRI